MMWIPPAPVSYSERSSESWHHGDFGQHQAGAAAAAAAIVVGADGTTYFGGAAEYQPAAPEELLYFDGSQYPVFKRYHPRKSIPSRFLFRHRFLGPHLL